MARVKFIGILMIISAFLSALDGLNWWEALFVVGLSVMGAAIYEGRFSSKR